MKSIIIYLALVFFTFFGNIYSQLTLEICQTKAQNNYPLIRQFDLVEQSKEFSLSNANKSYCPQLSLTVIGGVVDGLPEFSLPGQDGSSTKYNLISMVQLNQNIWDGGITSANKSIVEAETEIEKAGLEVSMYGIEDRVNNLYFGILLINEQIQQQELLKNNLKRNLGVIQNAVDDGAGYKSDLDEVRVEILNAEQRIDELHSNQKAYTQMLSAMIGAEITADEIFVRPSSKNSYLSDRINRPELSLFENQRIMLEAQNDLKGSRLYPKIGLMGVGLFINPGVSFGPSDLTRALIAGLSLSWEIGGLYTNSNNNQLTQIGLNKINVNQETFLFNTNLQLSQTSAEISKYGSLIEKDKEILKLKSRIKDAFEVKYENGISTMSELLDRINDESMATQNLIMHEIQYLMALYQHKNISGN